MVKFDDGTVVKYEGANEIQVDLITLTSDDAGKELVEAVKYFTSLHFEYMPVQLDDGWVCACGRYNHNDSKKCSCCGSSKEGAFNIKNKDFAIPLIQKYHDTVEKEQEEEEYELKKEKRNETVAAVIAGIAIAFIVVFVLTSVIILYMDGRY